MFNTLDLSLIPTEYKAHLDQGALCLYCTEAQVLAFTVGLACTGYNCRIVLLKQWHYKLIHESLWQVEEN